MTDTQQTTQPVNSNQALELSTAQSQLVHKLAKDLSDGGMSQESIGYIMGRIVARIAQRVLEDATTVVGAQVMESLTDLPDDQAKLEALDKAFQDKKSMTLFQYRDHVAEQMMAEYDSLTA